MGKKIPKVMAAEKEKLLAGFTAHGKLSRAIGEKLWKWIEPFAAYGFNKAHAASYGRVAYQTAYMKANFPVEYMSAVLTADSGNIEKISETIHECERMGIEILPPDINESFAGFSVVPNQEDKKIIRFGLTTIKNFGAGIAGAIIEERKAHGAYASLADFLKRVQEKNLNKKSLEALIMVGTFDRFAERGAMMANLDHLLEFNREHGANKASAHDSLFASLVSEEKEELILAPAPTATSSQKLLWEKELLGVFVSGHPLDACQEAMKKYQRIGEVISDEREGIPVTTAGLIEEVREIMTKKGEHMAFIRLADWEHTIELVIFPGLLKDKHEILVAQSCIAVKGRLSFRNGQSSIVAEMVKYLV
jgi:DNA polymerase-3 subunit alpha